MPKLTVNGTEVEVPLGATVMQACELAGAEIPRFCYHERLSIAGNCRMCLVEQERAPKPIASCAMPAAEGMVIHTDTPLVRKARRGVMEFLLINHPLDCPICDQGGECDLQDQAMAYGYDRSRFAENKRSVKDKNLGPIIKTYMNRCIHCTRCVRFASEVAGVPEMGATGRGENTEIGTYIEAALTSELSGNLVDLCPVGALTAKPYAFAARPWELRKTLSVDVLDGVGSAIRVDSRGNEVLRILPRTHDAINEEWISDKTRHAVDGLRTRRLDRPLHRVDGKLAEVSWDRAFAILRDKILATRPERIAALTGPLCDAEGIYALKHLAAQLGVKHTDCRPAGSILGTTGASSKVNIAATRFNSTIAGIDSADAILLLGTNPRWEAAVLNARIRRRYLTGKVKIALIGQAVDLTYPLVHLGDRAAVISELTSGKSAASGGQVSSELEAWRAVMLNAERPMIIVGDAVFARPDSAAIAAALDQFIEHFGIIREGWNGFNLLQRSSGVMTGLELGFVPAKGGKSTAEVFAAAKTGGLDLLYLLGVDEPELQAADSCFVVYQGHHGDAGAHRADLILPGAAYTEKSAIYYNTEGRPQLANLATFPPGEAREDWKIIRALADYCRFELGFNDLPQLRQAMAKDYPALRTIGHITPVAWQSLSGEGGALATAPLGLAIDDFYLTDPISRASKTMQSCSSLLIHGETRADPLEAEAVYG